jgi:hypothetical protein
MIPAKEMRPATTATPLPPIPAHPSTTQRAKTITAPQSVPVKVPLETDSALGEDKPNMTLVDLTLEERMRHLAEISESPFKARPFQDARSMKRQGKPLPPTDPQVDLNNQSPEERMRRVVALSESTEAQSFQDARSMKRQGKP